MKPCRGKKERIALLSVSALPDAEAHALQVHLKTCPGCRAYWLKVQEISHQHAANARALAAAEPSARFHAHLVRKIEEYEFGHRRSSLKERLFGWRIFSRWVWLTAPALILALAFIWFSSTRHSSERTPAVAKNPLTPSQLAPRAAKAVPAPSLAHYRQALTKSLDEVDELLTKESREIMPGKQSILTIRDRGGELVRSDVLSPE